MALIYEEMPEAMLRRLSRVYGKELESTRKSLHKLETIKARIDAALVKHAEKPYPAKAPQPIPASIVGPAK